MHPHLRYAVIVAAAAMLSRGAELDSAADPPSTMERNSTIGPVDSATPAPPAEAACPPGTLPDGNVCIPVPPPPAAARRAEGAPFVPRKPDRSPSLADYELPFAATLEPSPKLGVAGGVELQPEAPNSPVTLLKLEGQVGLARILFAGQLEQPTMISHHRVKSRGQTRDLLIVLSGLKDLNDSLASGQEISVPAQLGRTGSGAIRLEIRQVRHGVAVDDWAASELLEAARSIETDPRNVLPRR